MSKQRKATDVRQMCEIKGGAEFRTTKEQNGWLRNSAGVKVARVTIPKGRDPLKSGTLGSIARQLKLTGPQLNDFLDCTLSKDQYVDMLDSLP